MAKKKKDVVPQKIDAMGAKKVWIDNDSLVFQPDEEGTNPLRIEMELPVLQETVRLAQELVELYESMEEEDDEDEDEDDEDEESDGDSDDYFDDDDD